ncbi:MAG: DUF3794 domain-containing protein, partial [Bacillota bacterium]|nr:DUF3794 domain-containing protein [Bacillota bacterium]
MTLEKETMEWKQPTGKQASQILLEGDMIVPDSKPDLQEVLRCAGGVRLREKRITDGRISFSGEVEITALYRAKAGEKPLYAMTAVLPLEDFLHMDGLEKDMEVSLTAELEHLDCEIINDRKIGVRAVLLVEAKAWKPCCITLLTGAETENMETLKGKLALEKETAVGKERFTVKDELILSQSLPEMGEILLETLRLTEQELRPMDGKAQVRGKLLVELLYMDEEGKLGSVTEKIPFSGYLEMEGLTPKADLSGELTLEEHRLQPTVDEDGECRLVQIDATVGAMLLGKEQGQTEILLDAYMPEGNAVLQKERITYPLTVAEGQNQFTIKERIHAERGGMLHSEAVWGEVRLLEAAASADAMEVEGVLQVEILYQSAEEGAPLAVLRQGIPFQQIMESKGVRTGDDAEITLRLEELDFQMLSEGEGELRATIVMDGVARRAEEAEVITGIGEEERNCPPMAGAIIYRIKKGDSLWKIAKKHRATVAD